MKFKVKEIANINSDSLKKLKKGKIFYLDTANLTKNKIYDLVEYDLEIDKIPSRAKRIVKENDILISTVRPNQEHFGIMNMIPDNLVVSTAFTVISSNNDMIDSYFLYATLTQKRITEYLQTIAENSTSAYPSIKPSVLADLEIDIPPLEIQKNIGNLLKNFENKIELNNQIISTLEEIASTLFKRWFVEFEFPNENGNPYKSSGGKMVDSELGEIPEYWSIGVIGSLIDNYDRKRIPLSKLEREMRKGKYPYYGAASVVDFVDDFLFDGTYLLLGEDGTVATSEGFPILQYVHGKFWVNNHAHVLKGKDDVSTEWLYLWFKQTNITGIITGAVQPKISQRNLNNLRVVIPDKKNLYIFQKSVELLYKKVKEAVNENDSLIEIRDSLLPKLLSGKVEM